MVEMMAVATADDSVEMRVDLTAERMVLMRAV